MTNEAHIRIDEGIKRGPRKRGIKRHLIENAARQRARDNKGQYLAEYTPESRQAAVQDALRSLERGETVLDVATRHKIPRSTLESWLIASNDASEARSLFYAWQIAECIDGMRTAGDNPLAHARARDMRRAWAETAAVRDRNFAPKQEVSVVSQIIIEAVLDGHCERLLAKLAPQLPQRIIEVEPDKPVESSDLT